MVEKGQVKYKGNEDYVGFIACYKGRTIATSPTFKQLANKQNVRRLLGNKDLVIKHTVPEGMIAVYY
ncbi:MAG TPA: hypothetical protein VEG28_05350 [Dehalococcoidia bacterium]|nr:hypothetical protein [Dehalococcoidia bacterium]